ncbi:MAG: glycosyltransferase family 2 protein [Prevotella sp.]|nr:glycosyltransferase family 2 protein [Prevotella sp.]MBR1504845.1 glycosyltransferase family 2 protein [Prevotella sp.]
MKKISIVTPCYNEELNVEELYRQVKAQFELLKDSYTYEHIFIDNASTDRTVEILKGIAAQDKNVKIIMNAMNFGHIRSPYYGLCQATGDAAMLMVADLQDPPELIPQFIKLWEEGHKVVIGVKNKSKENPIMYGLRTSFYKMIKAISETRQIENFTGFGLYDQDFVRLLRSIDDPYPYMRGLVAEYGGDLGEVFFTQPKRLHGKTHNNFYTLYDMAMLGFVNHSKVPLRMASMLGFICSIISLLAALIYLVYKLFYWDSFQVGMAPLVIGLFFFASVQLFFLGVVGEYVGSILTQVRRRPLVIEKGRINFD